MKPDHPDALTRRTALGLIAANSLAGRTSAAQSPLDRRAIVSRHNPTLHAIDPRSPLSVGNGEFAFTADVTGMQSLGAAYEREVPLCTQAQWGWHRSPLPGGLDPSLLRLEPFDTYGRPVGYATSSRGQETLFNWLRENPHRLSLARIALLLDGKPLDQADLSGIEQTLDLWRGVIESRFQLQGRPVKVVTCCHPERDCVAIAVDSPLGARLSVELAFPYGSPAIGASDWANAGKGRTIVATNDRRSLVLRRELDANGYHVRLVWTGEAKAEPRGRLRIRAFRETAGIRV